ncbi:MAG TPA: class IV adenylate cyclase [Pyrinomonadaceae bacterium]
MGIEIEKKYRLDNQRRPKIIAKLKELGAEFMREDFEENYLHRGGLLDERSAVLRLRKIGDTVILTYKERIRNNDDIKHKIEYETEVADVDAIENIIEKLGYRLDVVYEKRRQTWHFDKVEVVMDVLPFGLYMEIEGSIEDIEEAEKLLGIEDLEPEPRGYPRLTAKLGKQKGNVFEARFD